ncbi:MAG: hypothetical protein HUJ76_10840, partial [Parasporobacterium sp.]|nr:hypothetical protein [Parasporobacterium sp.]
AAAASAGTEAVPADIQAISEAGPAGAQAASERDAAEEAGQAGAEAVSEGGQAEGESPAGESDAGESPEGESGAEGQSGAGGPGGPSGGGGDQNYGLNNDENSVIVVNKGVMVTENAAAGTYTLAEGGYISETGINGISVEGADDQSNGIYVSADEDDFAYTIGGDELYYEVPGQNRKFNSVIKVKGPAEDPDAECWYGTGITTLGGLLTVKNVYIETEGFRASDIYTPKGDHETNLIVKDSVLKAAGGDHSFIPDFKLMVGSARATLLLGEDIWFYNTQVLSRDWGALSHDSNTNDIQLYAVNTYAETSKGGYALYALNGTENFMYGCNFVSPQYGMFIMGGGSALFDSIEGADEAALAYAEGEDFSSTVTADGRSFLAGGCNAAVFHVNATIMDPGTLTIKNAVVSTMPDDIVSAAGSEMAFDLDSYLLSPVLYGESWFYMQSCLGSLITTRSHGAVINIEEGSELRSANGVLLQTMIAYDSGAGNIFHDSTDTRELKDVEININTPAKGDILHQDYQRNLFVNINSEYDGRVQTGTITSWNNMWNEEELKAMLEKKGMSEQFELTEDIYQNIRSLLVREEDASAYTDLFGVNMTLSADAVWNVRGESSVLSLEVAEGAQINAAEIYINCSFGADGFLDRSTGEKLDAITAGTYENVVLAE